MKKVFVVSLCLFGILLFAGTVFAVEMDDYCQVYSSTVMTDSEMLGSWDDCIEVCIYPDGWAEAWTYCNYSDYLIFTLDDLGTDARGLIGFSIDYPKTCHVTVGKRGNNLDAECLLDMFDGVRIRARGIPDNNCRCMEERG